MCVATTPSATAASAVLASGNASPTANAKPTMSFRSMFHSLQFQDARRRLYDRANRPPLSDCPLGHFPDPLPRAGWPTKRHKSQTGHFKQSDALEEEFPTVPRI